MRRRYGLTLADRHRNRPASESGARMFARTRSVGLSTGLSRIDSSGHDVTLDLNQREALEPPVGFLIFFARLLWNAQRCRQDEYQETREPCNQSDHRLSRS